MKRVLAILLCLILCLGVVLSMAACNDNGSGDPVDPNEGQQAHVHTFKTDADWSKDASGHWYDATCECADVTVRKLQHVDDNKDAICDVCKFEYDHEHTYAEDWTADCTNHWYAADCGCIIPGTEVGAHADENGDGECDVCKYVIEDLHKHVFATEWSSDGTNHWHAALCEHNVEVADKEAHNLNDAGYCTVCDSKVKEINRTDILAVLKAAIANNHKVVSGEVKHDQIVYNGSESQDTLVLLDAATDGVYFVLGNGQSYVFIKDYDENGVLIGGEQQWFERNDDESIFGIKMDVNSYNLVVVDGVAAKLNGYNYMPGDILMAGYEDTSTLAQTLYSFYDLMLNGENISDASAIYNEETGKYEIAYTHYVVNEYTTGGEVYDRALYLFEVEIEFSVNDDYVIDLANFQVKQYAYSNGGNTENDLAYDEETGVVTKTDVANPTYYTYEVSQQSGERTFTSPYPRKSLMPVDFELSYVTETGENPNGTMYVESEAPIVDVDGDGIVDLTVDKRQFVRLHIGSLIPSTALTSAMDTSDFEVTFKNVVGSGTPWGSASNFQAPTFSGYMNVISFFTIDPGTYEITIRFGQVTKVFTLIISGDPVVVVPEDTADTKYVQVTDINGWTDEYTFTATESGKYTFTIPAGLGFVVEGENPVADPFSPDYISQAYTYEFDLAKGKSITFNVGAEAKGVFAIGVAFVAGEVEGDDDGGDTPVVPPVATDIKGTYVSGELTVVIDETNVTFTKGSSSIVARYEISNGNVVLYNIEYGNVWGSSILAITLTDGNVTGCVYNGNSYTLTASSGTEEPDQEEGTGTESDPYVLLEAGDYVCEFPGQSDVVWYKLTLANGGYVTVSTTFGEGGWIKLGTDTMTAASNEGNGESLSAYFPAGSVAYIGVGDYAESTCDIPFTVAFEAKTSGDFSALVGTWYAESDAGYMTFTYELTINADGTGTLTYVGFGETNATVSYVFVDGEKVLIGYESNYSKGTLECTYDGTTFACTKGASYDSFTFSNEPIGGGEEDDGKVYGGGIVNYGVNTIVVTDADKTAGSFTLTFIATKTTEHKFATGNLFVQKVTGPDGDIAKVDYMYSLEAGVEYTLTISFMLANAGEHEMNITTPNYVEPVDDTAAVNGFYGFIDELGLYLMIYENDGVFDTIDGGYVAQFFDADWEVAVLYFAVTATSEGDGSYLLSLTYVSRPDYEMGTDKVDTILNQLIVITPDSGEGEGGGEEEELTGVDALVNTFVDGGLNGNNVGFIYDTDASVYYLNVYGGTQDLYYTAVPTENADGTITLALTLCTDHWSYYGATVTDEYELDGKTVIATPDGDTWTFATEGAGEEPTADGSFANPFELEANNSCAFPGGMNYKFYKYTATTAGTLTVTMTSADFFWAYGSDEYALETMATNPTADITLTAGQVVYVGISTNSMQAGTVEFTATFVESAGGSEPEQAQGSFDNPFELQADNSCEFPGGMDYVWYAYTATEAGSITITMTSSDYYWAYAFDASSSENVGSKASLTIALEANQTIYVGISTNSTYANTVTFTSEFVAGSAEETIVETPLVLGNNSVNGADIYFAYTAESDITLSVQPTNPAMASVTVTYSINGGAEQALANGVTVEIALVAGDKLVITAKTSGGYQTITVSEKVEQQEPSLEGTGTSSDPYIITELPYEIVFTGKYDKYYSYTATEDIVLTVVAPTGGLVSNDKSVTGANGVYTFNLVAGESVSLNLWTQSSVATEYTYTITGAAPEVEEGGEGGEATDAVTYISERHQNGRYLKVTIDRTAGTMTVVRSNMSGGWDASTSTAEYTISGTGASTVATNVSGQACTFVFGDDGVPTSVTWQSAQFVNFTQQ